MGLPNIGPLELIIVLAIILLVVGPRRLPEMGSAIGNTIREFRKASSGVGDATSSEPASKDAERATGDRPAEAPAQPAATTQPAKATQPDGREANGAPEQS